METEMHTPDADLKHFLRTVPLFLDVSDDVLTLFVRAGRRLRIGQGEILFLQGEPADMMYIVIQGCIAIFLATMDGRELVINEMRPGDCFGELALFTDQPRSTGAMGGEASEVVALHKDVFMQGMKMDPVLMRAVLDTTARRLQVSGERESALAFLSSKARVARVLLMLDQRTGRSGRVKTTQESLAQYVGLTRQTVAKVLGGWRKSGWVSTGRGRIRILDRPALEELAVQTDS
jgi:CRP/FNR family cyclic AMP-dependent transcriptional regulator